MDGLLTEWIRNWLNGLIRRVVVYNLHLPVTSRDTLVILLPALFIIFVFNMNSGVLDTLSKFVNDKSQEVQEGQVLVLHINQGSPKHKTRLRNELIESSPMEKDLGMLMNEKLNMSCPCALAAQTANSVLGCIKEVWPASQRK